MKYTELGRNATCPLSKLTGGVTEAEKNRRHTLNSK